MGLYFEKWHNEIDHLFHEFENIEYTLSRHSALTKAANQPATDARSIDEFMATLNQG